MSTASDGGDMASSDGAQAGSQSAQPPTAAKPPTAPTFEPVVRGGPAPSEGVSPLALLAAAVVCVLLLVVFARMRQPEPGITTDGNGGGGLGPGQPGPEPGPQGEGSAPTPLGGPDEAPPQPGTPDAGPQRAVFPGAGIGVTLPAGYTASQKRAGLTTQVAIGQGEDTKALVIVGPVFSWLNKTTILQRLAGTWHDGGAVKVGSKVAFASPATGWVEMVGGLVLLTPDRLVMVSSSPEYGEDAEVGQALSSLEFLPVESTRATYQKHFDLDDARAAAPPAEALLADVKAEVALTRSVKGDLPLPVASGLDAFDKGNLDTLDVMMLRDIMSPFVKAAKEREAMIKKGAGHGGYDAGVGGVKPPR